MTKLIGAKVPEHVHGVLIRRAHACGVKLSTYAVAVLTEHVAGKAIEAAPRATGLAAADRKTRSEVARAGVEGRNRKRKRTAKKVAKHG